MANTKSASSPITVTHSGSGASAAWTLNGLNGADDIDVNALLNATAGGHTGTSWKVIGGNGADRILGSYHAELIWGDSDKDSDTSANGADTIFGGGGNDEIHGGNGADFIQGDDGGDTLFGGRGPDTFNYVLVGDSTATAGHLWAGTVGAANSTGDWIKDFSKSEGDTLNLAGLNSQLTGGGPSMLQWTGTTPSAHGVWTGAYGNGTSDTIVYVDTSGDGLADVAIRVSGSIDGSAIVGANHGPVVQNDSNSVLEDHSVSGSVATNDSDLDGDTLTYSISGANPAGLTLNANGSYTFNAANAAYQHLAAGATQDVVATINVSDGHGGTTTETLTIHVTGVNDTATFGGADSGAVTEDAVPNTVGGTLTVSDLDDGQSSIVAQSGVAGGNGYGTFSINSSGVWSYTLNNSNSAVNGLNAGDHLQDTLVVHSADGTAHTITVTINGANDAATFTGGDSGSVTEDSASNPINGHLLVSDVDNPGKVVAQSGAAGSNGYGSFSIDADGNWTYTLDNSNAAVNALNTGSTPLTDTLTVTTDDGTHHTITVTINGANDAATFTGDDGSSVTEDSALNPISGHLIVSDVDNPGAVVAQTDATGDNGYGSFSIGADGSWTYTLDNSNPTVNGLNTDSTPLTDTLTVTTDDGTQHTITVTINGANDAATFGPGGPGVDEGSVDETGGGGDGPQLFSLIDTGTTTGHLDVSDVDSPATVEPQDGDTDHGHFSIDADGNWSFTLDQDNPDVQALNDGDTLTETITVQTADGTTHDIVITINGANDAATFTGDDSGTSTEDGTNPISGDLVVSDVDNDGKVVAQTDVAGDSGYGSFSIDENGHWTYSLDNTNPTVNGLNTDSAPLTDTITITTDDGTEHVITVTINGANDAPTADSPNSVTTDEDTASSAVAIGASDVDDSTLSYATKSGGEPAHGSVSYDQSAGTFTYTPSANYNGSDSFTIVVSDGHGGSVEQLVNVTVNPVNDAPTAASPNSVTTNEDTASTAVAIGASDVDGDTLGYATKSGGEPAHGSVTYDQGAGTFTYTPTPNYNGSDSFTIVVSDGHGGTVEQLVNVTVNPVNDAPTAASPNSVTTNEDTASAAVAIGASDVDGDTLSYATKSGEGPAHGAVTYDQGAGTFTYTPGANYNGSDSFTILVSDGHGGTVEQLVNVTVNPVDDPGNITGTKTGSVTEDAVVNTSTGALTVNDIDGPAGFVTQTNTAGTYGTFSIDASGNWIYTLDNSKAATNALGNSDHPTESFLVTGNDGATATVVVTVNGHADNDGHPPTDLNFTFTGDIGNFDNGTFLNKNVVMGNFGAHSDGDIGWAITNNPSNFFVIDPHSGQLSVGGNNVPTGTYTLTVSATDSDGSSSSNLIVVVGSSGTDTVNLGSATDPVFVMSLNGADSVTTGSAGDTIIGGGNNDVLVGGSGNDLIVGGAGNDRITGGGGADILNADQNNDTFVYAATSDSTFANADLIKNFTVGNDKIDLSALGTFTFHAGDSGNGSALGSHQVGVHYDAGSNATFVYVDTDGVAGADMVIKLDGDLSSTLSVSDFLLHP
jgi:VCBS repeat-containing protein